jgi:glucose/arabinose dehydrogenase
MQSSNARSKNCLWLGIAILTLILTATDLFSQLPTGFTAKKLTGDNINEAVEMVHAPDGRIFIAERSGNVKVYQSGVVTTVHTVATTTASEQGLLGITLHPAFSSNGKFYIFYTDPAMTVHYLDAVVINTSNQVTSSTRVMQFDPIINGFHNGGALLFKDQYLYVAIGESNSAGEAIKLDTYRGKILRLLDDGQPAPGNPYYSEAGASRQKRSIWAIGMRNPWKMSIDPVTKKIYVVNVGGNYEEVNDVTSPDPAKNYNYGWDQNGKSGPEQDANTIQPIFYYGHTGWGCAITTGFFFNPSTTNYPAQYRNRFYFTDWCSGWLRSFDSNNPGGGWQEFAASGFGSVLGNSVGIDGNIYYYKYNTNGSMWRIEYSNAQAPVIVNQPSSKTVVAGDPVSFSVGASGSTPFTYQWQKNSVNISGATASTYTISSTTSADAATYRCIVTNSFGSATSNGATLTVQPFNAKPVADITTPVATLKWNVLDVINFSGTATDQEDGTLAASAFKWEVRLYHKDNPTSEHWHPGPVVPSGVKSGSFTADNGGETSPNIWIRILLTVTDSNGRTGKDSVDIQPNKVDLTAAANFPGLKVVMGTENATPFTKTFVVNTLINLQAVTPQTLGNDSYAFSNWNHGGAASQSIRVPAANTTYTANFTITGSIQNPYGGTARTLPGKIEAEDFDTGGEGIAYHDATTGNSGNGYRTTENVDIEGCSEGGFNISYVAAGEWLEYTVNVTTPGTYTLAARVSTPGTGKTFHVELDGQNISGTINVPTTGGWQAWQTVSVTTTSLTTGTKVLRIVQDATDFNINYINFTTSGNTPPTVSITAPANNATFNAPADVVINATAADADGTVSKVEFFNGATKLGEDLTSPYSYMWTGVPAGTYSLTARATDNLGSTTTSGGVTITVNNVTGKNIPGLIQAESWDAMNGVQTEGTGDTGGGLNVGWIDTGDWMDYNVNVNTTGTYTVGFRVASAPGGGQLQLRSGAVTLATVNIAATGGWQTWTTLNATVNLTAGNQTLRVFASVGNWNFNWVDFASAGGNVAPTVSITSPANNANFTAPANITINASAADSDGSITQVQFYNGATLLGTDTTSPYSYAWNNVAAGNYSLTAKATDNGGLSTTSSVISITVTNGGTVNLALNKQTTVSSIENGGTPGSAAVDGNTTTRWSSGPTDAEWIYVDLGATYNVNRVKITWETALGKDYQIQTATSTAGPWTTIKTVTGNTTLLNDHTGLTGSGRYIKMNGELRGTQWGYSIFEIEVYGTSAGRLATSEIATNESAIELYPNPVDGILHIVGVKDGSPVTISATSGKETFNTKVVNGSIDVSHLPAGIYIIDYHNASKPVRHKLIKQ